MNYWFAEMTGMDLVTPLFDYIEVIVYVDDLKATSCL